MPVHLNKNTTRLPQVPKENVMTKRRFTFTWEPVKEKDGIVRKIAKDKDKKA